MVKIMANQQFKDLILSSQWLSFLLFFQRLQVALSYQTPGLKQVFSWLFKSREITNFTYDLEDINRMQLASMLAIVSKVNVKQVLHYFNEIEQDASLKQHIFQSVQSSSYRSISDFEVRYGRRIAWYAFVRILKPKVVIETGIDKGLGGCVLAAALLRNKAEGFPGYYYGTDINPQAGFLFTAPYNQVGEVLYGDSIESLKKFEQPIDFFINDSDHSAEYEWDEYCTIEQKLSPNALVLGDNSHTTDKLQQFAISTERQFLFYQEKPKQHWYPGAGIGIAWKAH
jgi:predicted O-methyltransferase YrrM